VFTTAARGLSMQVEREFRRQLPTIFLARTTLNTAHRIVYPFLPSIARGLGITLQAAGGLVTLRLAAGIAAPVLGPLGERHGRRRTMEFGLLLFTFACLLLAALGTFLTAAIAFLLLGFAKVLYDPAVHAYVGDTVPYRQRGQAVGLVELSWSMAWLVGVPASALLIAQFGWRAPWAVMAALGLISVWLTHRRLPPSSPQGRHGSSPFFAKSLIATWRTLLANWPVVSLLLTSFLLSMAIEVPFIVYGAWLEEEFGLSITALGFASIIVGLAEASAEIGTTLVTDRLGKRRSVLLGLLGLAASLAVLPWLSQHGLAAALAGVVLMVLTFEFGIVSLLPLATELAPNRRASLLSLNVGAFSLGRILGATLGGLLWQWHNIAWHAALGVSCALLAALALAIGVQEVGE
jgi:predicted MFS family arabinose efflux permease